MLKVEDLSLITTVKFTLITIQQLVYCMIYIIQRVDFGIIKELHRLNWFCYEVDMLPMLASC